MLVTHAVWFRTQARQWPCHMTTNQLMQQSTAVSSRLVHRNSSENPKTRSVSKFSSKRTRQNHLSLLALLNIDSTMSSWLLQVDHSLYMYMCVYCSALLSGHGMSGSAFAQHHMHISMLSSDVDPQSCQMFQLHCEMQNGKDILHGLRNAVCGKTGCCPCMDMRHGRSLHVSKCAALNLIFLTSAELSKKQQPEC